MKTSCINHPAKDPYIKIRQWQIDYCKELGTSAKVGAALLSLFEYYHNIMLERAEQNRHTNKVAAAHGDTGNQDEHLFQYHTSDNIVERILGIGQKNTILAARQFLVQKGAISEHKNPQSKYKFDKTIYFLFHPEVLIEYLKTNYPSFENQQGAFENQRGAFENQRAIEKTIKEDNKDYHLKEKEDGAKKPAPIPVEEIEIGEVQNSNSLDFGGIKNPDSLEAASFEKEKNVAPKKEKTAPAGFDVFAKQYGDFYAAQTGLELDLKKTANEKGMLAIFSELKKSAKLKYPAAPDEEISARAAKGLQTIAANWGSLSPYLKQQIAPSKLAANLPQVIMALKPGGANGQKTQNIQPERPDVAQTVSRFNVIKL